MDDRRRTRPAQKNLAASLRRLRSSRGREQAPASLSCCVACDRDFVVPVQWEPAGPGRWWMFLRCAECGISREVTVSDECAATYDEELARGQRALARTVRKLDLDRMADQVAAFTEALRHDFVEPADFAR